MKFSLLVPCYNAERYIDNFLHNVAQLTQVFDEIIFYDDASTDHTAELLLSKGCRVIKGEINKGPGYARNSLTEAATGDYIHFHDIDDEMAADYLAKTAAVAEQNQFDVVLCNVDWYDANTRNIVLKWEYGNKEINTNPVAYTISHPIGGINGLYRRTKFIEASGFNTQLKLWEDADVHVKLAARNASFYVIEEVLSYSLRYHQSASMDQSLGWLTRLKLLTDYQKQFTDLETRREIGKQAQIAASNLILYGRVAEARVALQLSANCNVPVPESNSALWRTLKFVLPQPIRIELRLMQLKHAFSNSTV